MSHSEKIYQALKSEFPSENGFSLQNQQGVKLEAVLEAIGFSKTIETEMGRNFFIFKKLDVDFNISVRETSERKPNLSYTANISMNG